MAVRQPGEKTTNWRTALLINEFLNPHAIQWNALTKL
jgi:hypothetical protein